MAATTTTGAATAAPVLTSLAAIKRAIRVGTRLEIVETDAPHLPVGFTRTVEVVQGNAIAARGVHRQKTMGKPADGLVFDPDTLGWLYWPKASEVTTYGDDRFTLDYGRWSVTYRVLA